MQRTWVIALLLSGLASAVQAEDAASVFARFKAASGAEQWDTVQSWRGDGTLSSGGLSGEFHATVDVRTGRSADIYKLGPVDGADGYDGKQAWEKDPGGEVAALDAPEAMRRARSQAWLDARAYWYPQRMQATYGNVETKDADGRNCHVVAATPNDGDPVGLWFGADTGLLVRTVQRQGQDTATTVYDDYRDVDGLRMPFHIVIDLTDAAGRTDPRRRTELRFEHITLNVTVADSHFAMPRMAATARIDATGGIARIPFDLVNNHIYVDATIGGKPARLMVDTGGINMLTPAAAERLGIAAAGQLSAAGVGEQRTDLAVGHGDDMRIGPARLDRPVFYIVDLGQLQSVEGVALDGLVGYEMFRRFATTIDYAQHRLTLSTPEAFVAPAAASIVPFDLDDHVPIVAATLGGLPTRISIDTGSRSALTVHSPFARSHDLAAKYRAAPECVIGWGVGGAARGRPARLPTLRIGDQRIDGVAGELFMGDKGSFANPDLGGNIGGGVLRRFTVAFDYANRKMYLAPNADFARPDAFDRSGLWLLHDGDALKVVDVAKDSAAERAGLHGDDRIVAIGGEAVDKRALAEWRQQLRQLPAGTRLPVRYERGGDAREAMLVLADRIPAAARQ